MHMQILVKFRQFFLKILSGNGNQNHGMTERCRLLSYGVSCFFTVPCRVTSSFHYVLKLEIEIWHVAHIRILDNIMTLYVYYTEILYTFDLSSYPMNSWKPSGPQSSFNRKLSVTLIMNLKFVVPY